MQQALVTREPTMEAPAGKASSGVDELLQALREQHGPCQCPCGCRYSAEPGIEYCDLRCYESADPENHVCYCECEGCERSRVESERAGRAEGESDDEPTEKCMLMHPPWRN